MNRRLIFVVRGIVLAIVIGLGVLLIVDVLTGCTLVYVEGDANTVRDVGGGHGRGLIVDDSPPLSGDRLRRLQNPDQK
jgi:hypothetical protein